MDKFIVRVTANMSVTYEHKFLLNPRDFLDCKTIDEVRNKLNTLTEEAFGNDCFGDVNIDSTDETVYMNYNHDSNSVDDFINEWQKLKNNDNCKSN